MSFFKKLFKFSSKSEEIKEQEVFLSLDDSFVHYFKSKGGKFLYCSTINEVSSNLVKILEENNWKSVTCFDNDLKGLLNKSKISVEKMHTKELPFFTTCEHLISNNGDILFSSNQLKSNKLASLSQDFIVYATTSQFVKNTSEALTGIKINFKGNIPTNISAVKNYNIDDIDDNFLNYGNSNTKNLYLLLFEDL